ncbi:mitochondrial carrier [Calocera cornea HHB12733]|uniref:Mitochondrial carrier n=1 Tax=Calocera cornea HHB12733 TaxID=1353952 RepID=A0A165GRH3_9BASI|nr:mitochondrial carrier [Calocera cornea HHB12733]
MTTPTAVPAPIPAPLSTLESFICGGLAACCAVTISNPPEVAKTRLQLDGELAKQGSPRVYRNVLDVFAKTWRNEGIRGIQRGLGPAYVYQILLNGSRLGFYEPFRLSLNRMLGVPDKTVLASTSIGAGVASGGVGAALGNPLFLIKARMQAYSPALPVGAQRYYKNSWDALSTVVRAEGPRGLLRGIDAALLRTCMGSSVQLPSYNLVKTTLVQNGWRSDGFWTFLASSSVSGATVCVVMQPADTVLTRMYNQPTAVDPKTGKSVGLLYKNPIDCLWKTLVAEGPFGWYKGTVAHFLRIAPHTIVTLTANELIMALYLRVKYRPKPEFKVV